MLLVVEQILNGLQFGLLLFLLAAGLTLVFGIMDLVNLAHGSLYMMGAYFAATFVAWTGNFLLGAVLALGATLLLGILLEFTALRHLYGRDHLDHVLATFGLILFFNEAVRLIWGPAGLALPLPAWLAIPIPILPGIYYPAYRLAIIVVALLVALLLYLGVMRTRIGMLIRAGASNREMIAAVEMPEHDKFQHDAEHERRAEREQRAQHEVAGPGHEGRREIGTHHVERAVRQVDEIHDPEHQRQPRGEQEQQEPELQAIQDLFDDEKHQSEPVDPHALFISPLPGEVGLRSDPGEGVSLQRETVTPDPSPLPKGEGAHFRCGDSPFQSPAPRKSGSASRAAACASILP